MSNNKGANNDADKTGDAISWVIVIILLALPPTTLIGLILLLVKLGVFSSKKNIKKRTRFEKKIGKGLPTLLLLVSIGLFFAGVASLASWNEFLGFGIPFFLGSVIAFLSRNNISRRYGRYKNYFAFIDGRGIVPISDIAQMAGLSIRAVKRDLQAMINNDYLAGGTYIDNELECLVLSAEAADKMRSEILGAQDIVEYADYSQIDQYAANLAELREVNAFINDETISQKVSRLEDLTAKIFKIVEEAPEKKPQLRRFMSYYLPTTLKLVRSYATLEKQGVKGENILNAKASISNILDTLSTGFEQQLDQLFKSDALDIATDVSVLENLMQQDGLTGSKTEFQVAESGTS